VDSTKRSSRIQGRGKAMIAEHKKTRDEYFNLMNALADSVVDMSDAEIEEELKGDGDNTEEIRGVLLNSVRLAKQHALVDARKEYESRLETFKRITFDLPNTLREKRDLLKSMVGKMSQPQQLAFTGQFREFEKLADEDLDGILMQLFALQSADEQEGE